MEHLWAAVLGLAGLLAVAVLMMPPANRTSVPYTVLLAAVGCVLGLIVFWVGDLETLGPFGDFLAALDGFELTADAVFFIFLPVLVFEAALSIDVRRLLDDLAPILFLAVVGLLISTFFIGYALHLTSGVTLLACFLLGAIVSATDPVAVVSIFKNIAAPKRLSILVEGESLFNDATAIVVFLILAAMLGGESDATFLSGSLSFVKTFVGGVAVGYVAAQALCALLARLREVALVQIALTISLAYLSFVVAEHYLHVSGVMAVVSAALVMGSRGRTIISPQGWHGVHDTWEQLGFWANSLIFILVGMAVPRLMGGVNAQELLLLAVVVVAAFAVRAAIIFGLVPVLSRSGLAQTVSPAFRTVMWWGGLRGAVSLGLALIVMENARIDEGTRSFIAVLVTGFVLFTLFVNATTIRLVLRICGLDRLSPVNQAIRDRAMSLSLANIGASIQMVGEQQQVARSLTEEVVERYRERGSQVQQNVDALQGQISEGDWVRVGLSMLGTQERNLYMEQFGEGFLSSEVVRRLVAQCDDLSDALKTAGAAAYQVAAEKALAFDWRFRLAMLLQYRFGRPELMARRLAERFEVLLAQKTSLRKVLAEGLPRAMPLVGQAAGERLREVIEARLETTVNALAALGLQYPDYERSLERRYIERGAIRLEEANYKQMLEDAVISSEVFSNLAGELEQRTEEIERAPRLDLGLDPEKLVAKVPLFQDLPPERIAKIVSLLKPRLAIPGEKVVAKGSLGDAMYFISSGALEAGLEPPVRMGSGDFFGEIALVTDQPRTVDVVAQCFCDLLLLYRQDLDELLQADPELQQTIERVARERLGVYRSRMSRSPAP